MKKGFTLIELLAVIIILAVIALIATPIVLDVVESAKRSAFESTTYGMVDAMKLNSAEDMIDGNSMAKEYTFPSTELDVQGEQLIGSGKVDSQGRLAIAVNNGKWCATKSYNEGIITVKDYVDGECTLAVEEEVTYNVGDYVKVKVGPNEEDVYNFYVLSVEENKLTLIMDRNLDDNIDWASSEKISELEATKEIDTDEIDNDELYEFMMELGPVTAKTQLPTTWSNASKVRLPNAEEIIAQTEWYKGLTDTSSWETLYDNIMNNSVWESELFNYLINACYENEPNNKCFRESFENSGFGGLLLPKWLDINLSGTGYSNSDSYWTTNVWRHDAFSVYAVSSYDSTLSSYGPCNEDKSTGVRPVIEINEQYILEKLTDPQYVDEGFSRE